ncbi:MAG: hypothetical protein IJ740_01555 [Ruminococcus sp.]|nr:hypothetical protein [Ruminococcus sp.]
MKKMGIQISLLMGVTLSFCLSLTGLVSAGQFSVPALIINFLISFIISMIIGLLVPMKKVGDAAVAKAGLEPMTLKAKLLESLLSDLIYTPIITICMILMARQKIPSDKLPPFATMLIKSLVISLIVGYILIFIFQPMFLKFVMKKNSVGGPPTGAGAPPFKDNEPRD